VDLENKQYPLVITERRLRYKGFECQCGRSSRNTKQSLERVPRQGSKSIRDWITPKNASALRSQCINIDQISYLRAVFCHTCHGVRLGQALALSKDTVTSGYAGVVRMKGY
jgi:hypothetical protein